MPMKKAQSAIVGIVLAAGAVLHVATPLPSRSSAGSKSNPRGAAPIKPVTGEGPWLASCKYWTTARWQELPAKKNPPTTKVVPSKGRTNALSQESALKDAPVAGCENSADGWGIPAPPSDDAGSALSSPSEDPH